MPNRKPKTSYSCAPCKRLKIKCDHNVPCSSCVRNDRQDECLLAPAKTLTQFKELIKPNPSFGRISKPSSSPVKSQSILSDRKKSKGSSISSISSFEGPFSSPEETASTSASTSHERDNAHLMEAVVRDQSAKLEQVTQRNAFLTQQNSELLRQVGFYFHMASRPGIHDYGCPHLDSDKMLSMKKMMIGLLPIRNVGAILKKHYFVCVSYMNDVVDPAEFERDYEKMWSHIVNDRAPNVDLSYLALVLMVLCLGLRAAPRELLLSNEGLLRLWGSPEAVETTCMNWFKAARQIMAFYKQPGLMRTQVFLLQCEYCYLTGDMETLDELLPSAVFDAKKTRLNDPSQNTSEIGKTAWWSLCVVDTMRALNTHRMPLIMCCYSRVGFPEKALYIKHRAEMTKVIASLFTFDFSSMSLPEKLNTVIEVDQKITTVASEIPKPTGKVTRFQRTALHSDICTMRFRLYESFLPYDIPIASELCTYLTINAFTAYNELKQLYIVSQDPLYIVLSPFLTRTSLLSSVFLIRHTRLNLADIESIKSNIDTLRGDLMAMECFSPLPVVTYSIQSVQYLSTMTLQNRRRSSDSIKMRLNSIINSPMDQIRLDRVPMSMTSESLRLAAEAEKGPMRKIDRDRVEEEIQRRWGEIYEDYCAFVR